MVGYYVLFVLFICIKNAINDPVTPIHMNYRKPEKAIQD